MARFTLDQINSLIPDDSRILQNIGIQQRIGDDGNPVYYDAEGQKVNPGQIEQILSGRDQSRQQALTQNGVIQLPSVNGDLSFFNRSNGTNFKDIGQYYDYLYGGGERVGTQGSADGGYYVLPDGQSTTDYKNAPLSYNPPPSTGFKLTQAAVLALAAAGMGGMLPGTESAFGGAGLGGVDAGINAGGLDGALGDTLISGITPGTYGAGAAAGAGGAGLSGGLGGDMGFFSDYLGDSGLTDIFSGSTDMGLSGAGGFGGETPWWANLPSYGDPLTAAGIGGGATAAGSGLGQGAFGDILTAANSSSGGFGLDTIKNLYNGAKSLFGGGSGDSSGFNLGDLLGGKNVFGTALSTAPFLAAVNYAQNQDPFDTSRLTSLYDKYNPDAAAFEYDQNTGTGRRNLTDSLTSRGVMGSSFGNSDINSFNTNRELGRQSLINSGVSASAGIASSILDAQVKERALKNDLYGRALSGLGSALNPKSSIFG